jgi:hypothetical protein
MEPSGNRCLLFLHFCTSVRGLSLLGFLNGHELLSRVLQILWTDDMESPLPTAHNEMLQVSVLGDDGTQFCEIGESRKQSMP